MHDTASVKISRDTKMILVLIEHSDPEHIKRLLSKNDNQSLSMLSNPVRWGITDSSEDIDRYIYEEH